MPKKKPPLTKEYLENKVRELYREIVGSLTLTEMKLPENLEGQDRIDFARYCYQTYHSRFFPQMKDALYLPLIMHIGQKATTIEEVSFHRATANGIDLVEHLLQKWANIYDDDYSADKRKEFDPQQAFEKTTINEN